MRRVLLELAWIAAISAGLAGSVALLGAFAAGGNPYLDLAAQFLGPLSWLTGIGAILLLALRQPIPAVTLGTVAIAGICVIWPRDEIKPCPMGTVTHRVVFQNVWASNPNPAAVEAYLETTNADAVVLAEDWATSQPVLGQLSAHYPFTIDCNGNGTCGTRLYSKFPFVNRTKATYRAGGPRSLIAADIAFPDGTLHLVGTHLTRPWPFQPATAQPRQAAALAESFASAPQPSLLIGDLNAVTWGHTVTAIRKLSGARPLPSWGTWHALFPLPFRIPIDQAIAGSGIACARKVVGPHNSSDHRPIIVDFAFAGSAK